MAEDTFRQRYPDLTILDPAAFLKAIARGEQPEPTRGPGLGNSKKARGGKSLAQRQKGKRRTGRVPYES